MNVRRAALAVAVVAALAWLAHPPSDHPDALRDWLAARDCVVADHCWLSGSATSLDGLHNGTLWPLTLAWLHRLGGDLETAWWLVVAATAAAVGVVHTAAVRARLRHPTLAATCFGAVAAWSLSAHALWAPALLPLFAALATLYMVDVVRQDRLPGWSAGAGMGWWLGLMVDSHPASLPAIGAMLAAVGVAHGAASARPIGAALGVAAGVATLLAPEAQWANAAAVIGRSVAVAGGVAAVALLAGGLRRWHADRDRAVWMLTAGVPTLALLAGWVGSGQPIHVRYALALAPAAGLTLALAATPLSTGKGKTLAAALGLATLALLGPGRVSAGHTWPQVVAAAQLATSNHLRYPALIGQVQSHACRKLAAAIGAAEQAQPATDRPTTGATGLQWIDLPDTVTPGAGWQAVAGATGDHQAWMRAGPVWLDATSGHVCLQVPRSAEVCAPIVPGIMWLADGSTGVPSVGPWHVRAYPRLVLLRPPALVPSTTTATVSVRAPAAGTRWMRILDLPRRRCRWRVAGTTGVQWRPVTAEVSALTATAATTGTLTLTRAWGPGCDESTQWSDGPPCLIDVAAGSAWLHDVVVP